MKSLTEIIKENQYQDIDVINEAKQGKDLEIFHQYLCDGILKEFPKGTTIPEISLGFVGWGGKNLMFDIKFMALDLINKITIDIPTLGKIVTDILSSNDVKKFIDKVKPTDKTIWSAFKKRRDNHETMDVLIRFDFMKHRGDNETVFGPVATVVKDFEF